MVPRWQKSNSIILVKPLRVVPMFLDPLTPDRTERGGHPTTNGKTGHQSIGLHRALPLCRTGVAITPAPPSPAGHTLEKSYICIKRLSAAWLPLGSLGHGNQAGTPLCPRYMAEPVLHCSPCWHPHVHLFGTSVTRTGVTSNLLMLQMTQCPSCACSLIEPCWHLFGTPTQGWNCQVTWKQTQCSQPGSYF